jgi:hypothetical protein
MDRPSVSLSSDEFLALVVAHVVHGGEEFDTLQPLLLGQLDLADEGMQMLHQAGHDVLQARIGRAGKAGDNGLGDVVLIEIAH